MALSTLEHVNITVSDPMETAVLYSTLFDWHIRWQGDSINGGTSVHVGSNSSYIAVYSPDKSIKADYDNYITRGGLNHIGVVVEDLDEVEARVVAAGLTPHSHGDYEPGRRFYFHDKDNIEIEVVSYAPAQG